MLHHSDNESIKDFGSAISSVEQEEEFARYDCKCAFEQLWCMPCNQPFRFMIMLWICGMPLALSLFFWVMFHFAFSWVYPFHSLVVISAS